MATPTDSAMNHLSEIRHFCRYLLRRHRVELALALASSCLIPIAFHTGASLRTERLLGQLSIILHAFAILRIGVSDSLLKTFGQSQAVPTRLTSLIIAQITVLLSLWTLSSFTLQIGYQTPLAPSNLLKNALSYSALSLAPLLLFSHTVARWLSPDQRRNAFSILFLLLIPAILWLSVAYLRPPSLGSGGTTRVPEIWSTSIRASFPAETEFLGDWGSTAPHLTSLPSLPPLHAFLRIPLADSRTPLPLQPGSYLRERQVDLIGDTTEVRISITEFQPFVIDFLSQPDPLVVIRYANGKIGAPMESYRTLAQESAILGHQARGITLRFTFASPLGLPEWRSQATETWRPLELIFFRPQGPLDAVDQLTSPLDPPRPLPTSWPTASHPEKLRHTLEQALIHLNLQDPSSPLPLLFDATPPPASVEMLLHSSLPWNDLAWRHLVQPTLITHARPDHLPLLMARLRSEPRLTSIFIHHRWQEQALPILRSRVFDLLPLPVDALQLLLPAADAPTLEAISTLVVRDGIHSPTLISDLRRHPHFPWARFTAQAWQSYRDHAEELESGLSPAATLAATWAAEQGDASALTELIRAALLQPENKALLTSLITLVPSAKDQHPPIAYLQSSSGRLVFQPATHTWAPNP